MTAPRRVALIATTLAEADSSRLAGYAFDPNDEDPTHGTLTVQFRVDEGAAPVVFQYKDVPAELWERFQEAPSRGQFLIDEIRGPMTAAPKYKYQKLSLDEILEHISFPEKPAE